MPGPNQWITQHVTIMSPLKTLLGPRRNSNFSPIQDFIGPFTAHSSEIPCYCWANFDLQNVCCKTKVNTGDPHYWSGSQQWPRPMGCQGQSGTSSMWSSTIVELHKRERSQCAHYTIDNGEFIGQRRWSLCCSMGRAVPFNYSNHCELIRRILRMCRSTKCESDNNRGTPMKAKRGRYRKGSHFVVQLIQQSFMSWSCLLYLLWKFSKVMQTFVFSKLV